MDCGKLESIKSTRIIIAGMICLACIIFAAFRSSISITILAMTSNPYNSSKELPNYGSRYEWSAYEQSLVLGSYFWGNTVICSFAGVFAERYGARNILGFSFAMATILSAVSSVGAQFLWLMFLNRFLTGITMGTVFPSLHALIANWAPPEEKGKFLSLLTFNGIGAVLDWSASGYIIENYGWKTSFYIVAVMLGLFSVLWFAVVYDTPSKHPRISEEEKEFILSKLTTTRAKKKPWPPFRSIFLSIPFWALLCFYFGDVCGYYFLLTSVPRYLSELVIMVIQSALSYKFESMSASGSSLLVHSFSITSTGLLASIPFLARVPFAIMFGYINDLLFKKKAMSPNSIRKCFSICSHFIPGCFLIGINYVSNQPYICVAFLTIALCFNSAIVITASHNAHDLSPNFAVTIYGLISLFGTTAGYLAPLVVAYFTKYRSTKEEWQNIFFVGAVMFIASNIIFIIFGSGYVQKWNSILDEVPPDVNLSTKLLKNKKTESNEIQTI